LFVEIKKSCFLAHSSSRGTRRRWANLWHWRKLDRYSDARDGGNS